MPSTSVRHTGGVAGSVGGEAVRGMRQEPIRTIARCVLGVVLVVAGIGHLTSQRVEFRAQVPSWFPVDADIVVLVSGVIEILLGVALVVAGSHAAVVGVVVAAFFIVIYPGNIAQFLEHRDAFGLDSDAERFVRLLFQPLLVLWALWSTGGWRWLRSRWRGDEPTSVA